MTRIEIVSFFLRDGTSASPSISPVRCERLPRPVRSGFGAGGNVQSVPHIDGREFTVWVGDELVAQKGWIRFPSDQRILEAVRSALG
jgi:hypothetical protein